MAGKTKQIVNLINLLAANEGLSQRELSGRLRVSERSIYRYLKDLKEFGYLINSITEPENAEKKHFLTPLSFTGEEAVAISSAVQSLYSQEGLPISEALNSALIKVKAAVCKDSEKKYFYNMQEKYLTYLNEKTRSYAPWFDEIKIILDSIRKNFTIDAIYDSTSSGKKDRRMDPYQFCWNRGELYLVAFCYVNNEIRSFKMNRFLSVKKTKNRFKRNHDFCVKEYLSKSWRVYRGTEKMDIKLLVYPPISRYFRESCYHETQKVEEIEGGKIHCTLTCYDTPEFRSWLLGWGKGVEVLEPPALRESIREELQRNLENYQK